MEQKKIELEKAKQNESELCKKYEEIKVAKDKIPDFKDVKLYSTLAGPSSVLVTLLADKFLRDGGNILKIDNYKDFFINHPEQFERAKELTGSTNLDYICELAVGHNNFAETIYTACGLRDFFLENFCLAGADAAIVGATVFAVPVATAYVLHKYYDQKMKNAANKCCEAKEKKCSSELEYQNLKKSLDETNKQEQGYEKTF